MNQNRRPWFVPPIWLTIIMLVTGILGTNLVYHAFTGGTWRLGFLGLSLMALAVLVLGTPLGYLRYLRKSLIHKK